MASVQNVPTPRSVPAPTLGERMQRMQQAASTPSAGHPTGTGQHVWVQMTDGWAAGLLVLWARGADRLWWGHVVVVDADGDPAVMQIRADRLRPAPAPAPAG